MTPNDWLGICFCILSIIMVIASIVLIVFRFILIDFVCSDNGLFYIISVALWAGAVGLWFNINPRVAVHRRFIELHNSEGGN